MKEESLPLATPVRLVTGTDPSPAQLAAWRQLWSLLLRKEMTLCAEATARMAPPQAGEVGGGVIQ